MKAKKVPMKKKGSNKDFFVERPVFLVKPDVPSIPFLFPFFSLSLSI